MGFQTTIYNLVFKRTSTLVLAVCAGSFLFERSVDVISDTIFESYNQGKLWKHIKHNYEK